MLTQEEQRILDSIIIASENNPNKPEFPADNPKFPATSTYKINLLPFSNVWFKDESTNPTGTHKDRMAWEMVVTYRDFLLSKKNGKIKTLPKLSIITSGSAGFAIQSALKRYNLPNLKCLVDTNTNQKIIQKLKDIGCEIYLADLSKKALSWKEILTLTDNKGGIDITSSKALDPTTRYYDWLSYEIVNNSPDYCFIPFGTGNLYENILNVNKKEVSTKNHDPRFKGNVQVLRNCNFLGATTADPKTKAQKLFSPHLPFLDFNEQWISTYKLSGYCGEHSDVHLFEEKYLNEAIKIAKKLKLNAEPSALAGLALLLKMKESIPKNAKILIVSTGKSKCEPNEKSIS